MSSLLKKMKYAFIAVVLVLNILMVFDKPVYAERETANYLWRSGTGCPSSCGTGGNWFECTQAGSDCYGYYNCMCEMQ